MTPSTLASANDLAHATDLVPTDKVAPTSTSTFQEPAQREESTQRTSAFVVPTFPRPTPHHSTLNEARALVDENDRGKWDAVALRRDLTFKDGGLAFSGTPLRAPEDRSLSQGQILPQGHQPGSSAVRAERLAPSPYALGQLCARLGIPVSYLRQCPFILQDQNINYWLKAGSLEKVMHEQWLLRARHGTLRAVLSQHYSPLDNRAVMDALAPVLPSRYRVQWLGLEDESFHLRLLDPSRAHAVLPGDDFFVGVHVANSEVGQRSLTVDAMLYRLVCSNGMVALVQGRSLLRQRHIHVAAPRFRAALEEALSQALQATDVMLLQLEQATRQTVPDAGLAIERLARHWHLSQTTEEVAKAALLTESPQVQGSAYGLLNAFTAAAQILPDDKRYDLELLAGTLAERGVPRFALAPRESSDISERERGAQQGEEDAVQYARRLFGGRVMRRLPHPDASPQVPVGGES